MSDSENNIDRLLCPFCNKKLFTKNSDLNYDIMHIEEFLNEEYDSYVIMCQSCKKYLAVELSEITIVKEFCSREPFDEELEDCGLSQKNETIIHDVEGQMFLWEMDKIPN